MFSWLTGKDSKERVKNYAEKESPSQTKSIDLTSEIKTAIDIYLSSNAKPSLLYAKAAGYDGEVIDYSDIQRFLECLRVDHRDLNGPNADAAKSWIENDLNIAIKSDFWESFFFNSKEHNSGKAGYKEIKDLRVALLGKNIASLWQQAEQSVGDYALAKAIEHKCTDLERIYSKLEEKKDTLKPLLHRALSSGKNKYGETDFEKYFQEIEDFFDYFFPEGALKFYFLVKPLMEAKKYIDVWFEGRLIDTSLLPEDGIDFEHWCAARLEEQGWKAIVSQASGDQGVDVEARWGEFIVAVQCKRYTKPIGNRAVQEIYTGAKNINADAAAVIGTGGYTKSASAIAKTTSVELFDAAEIETFSERFGFKSNSISNNNRVVQPIVLDFSSLPERMLALMFRTVLKNFDLADANLSEDLFIRFFDHVDDRGVGQLSLDEDELAYLLIFSNLAFTASFCLTPENIESLRKHDYPMLPRLELERKGDDIFIFELIGGEVIGGVREIFLNYSLLLPIPIELEDHFLFRDQF